MMNISIASVNSDSIQRLPSFRYAYAQHLHVAEADGVISYSVDLDRVEVVRLYWSLMDTAMYKSSIQTNVVARLKV